MGTATIIENVGEGLYRVRLNFDLAPLEKELATLTADKAAAVQILADALRTRRLLLQSRDDAEAGMNEVIQQWRDALIEAGKEDPPPPPLDDPMSTPEDEQPDKLLSAINAERSSPVARVAALDLAARTILWALSGSGRTDDVGSSAERRATQAGYSIDSDIGAESLFAFGMSSAASAVSRWTKGPRYPGILTDTDYSEAGCAYLYRPGNPYTHLWCSILSAPGAVVEVEPPKKDPAKESADEVSGELEKIETPTVETFEPKKMGDVCAIYGRAAAEFNAADREVARLEVEAVERDKRIALLGKIKSDSIEPIYAWACQYVDDLALGSVANTAEVPGWYLKTETARTTEMADGRSVAYQEREVNLVPSNSCGRVRDAETMSAESVFANLALEPGALKWKPRWRYGVVTARDGGVCSVILEDCDARTASGLGAPLSVLESKPIHNVPIYYPCATAIKIGDEVLVEYASHDRSAPRIIGYRREPVLCEAQQTSWGQIH